jgi:hypothetical protein
MLASFVHVCIAIPAGMFRQRIADADNGSTPKRLMGSITMADTRPHEMFLIRIHTSGAEEWHCPTCGRRFLMHWPPAYKKIVLEAGDEYAAHIGGSSADRADALYGGSKLQSLYDDNGLFYTNNEPVDELFANASASPAPATRRPLPVEEVGPVPITSELLPWVRWMRAAGLADEPV